MAKKKDKDLGLGLGLGLGVAMGVALGAVTGEPSMWLAIGISVGLLLGVAYDKKQAKRSHTHVKVVDGATFTVVERVNPKPGQRNHYWLGDNGAEIELTESEATEFGLG